jgi:hypothetical protein
LRDGAQAEGISFTVNDKIRIARRLDSLGVDYIEAGNPGSNPKDMEFFDTIKKKPLSHAKLTAFGSTRRPGIKAEDDANVKALLTAGTDVVAIFGKSWDFHVTDIIRTTLEENLNMIRDTVSFFKAKGKEVVFDAEHFFDGYKANKEYALKTLEVAKEAGADSLALCDTNGGCFPFEITEITGDVVDRFDISIGIHCHNDGGMAEANSIMAVEEGANQVQGTFNGYGERCGNADLSVIIPNLQLKRGKNCIKEEGMLRIKDHLFTLSFKKGHSIPNHIEIFFQGGPYDVRHVKVPTLSEDGYHIGARRKKGLHISIILRLYSRSSGAAKSCELCMAQRFFLYRIKKLHILWVGTGIPRFYIIYPQRIQPSGYPYLVVHRKGYALSLSTVPQSRVIDINLIVFI